MSLHPTRLEALAAARWRIALRLTGAMVLLYFGFISLVAFGRPLLATLVVPGLTLGILLGALVIVASWLLTWVYVRWANAHYDRQLEAIGAEESR
ncbi:MAG: DUF485 domain-containing protein [Gemmatimonadales bacterium]|nr:DUF485 domain-containing protein [Gemmatimonadales bacterium]